MTTTATPESAALAAAANDLQLANRFVKQYLARKVDGAPADLVRGTPAFTAAQYLAAMASLGSGNQAIMDALAAANPQD